MKQATANNKKKALAASAAAAPSAQGGAVQVAIWKEHPEMQKYQDTFALYSSDVFYDFAKPLKLLDSPGWHPQIQAGSADGFFVFTVAEQGGVYYDDAGSDTNQFSKKPSADS